MAKVTGFFLPMRYRGGKGGLYYPRSWIRVTRPTPPEHVAELVKIIRR